MDKKIVMANWKMNGSTKMLNDYFQVFMSHYVQNEVDVAFFPPAVYLKQTHECLDESDISVGAQNVSDEDGGAFTGEVAANMLKDFGCRYALVGHSERRELFKESDEFVARKAQKLIAGGFKPVVCIGESLEERKAGKIESVLTRQLDTVLNLAGEGLSSAVIAYEPIWAIGTGVSADPAQIAEVHAFLREKLQNWHKSVAKSMRIVYGGSVKTDNAAEIFAINDVDGALVGGASLDPTSFSTICQAARM